MRNVSIKELEHYKEFKSLKELRTFIQTSPVQSKLYLYGQKRLTDEIVNVSQVGPEGHEMYDGITDKEWDLEFGYDRAWEILAQDNFWPEGKDKFKQAFFKARDGLEARQAPAIGQDVAGYAPNVPEFLTGASPTVMFSEDPATANLAASLPVIKIGINQVNSPEIDPERLMNRGAAMLAMIDDIEKQGFRTEVYSCGRVATCVCVTPEIGWDVLLKPASRMAEPSLLAFPLCHPAWGVRIGYRIVESFPAKICDMCGYVTSVVPNDHDYDIYIEPCSYYTEAYQNLNTPEEALAYYQEKFQQAIDGRIKEIQDGQKKAV